MVVAVEHVGEAGTAEGARDMAVQEMVSAQTISVRMANATNASAIVNMNVVYTHACPVWLREPLVVVQLLRLRPSLYVVDLRGTDVMAQLA